MTKCVKCGQEMEKELPPLSAMGERMWNRGLEVEVCRNPRCEWYGQ